MRPSSTQCFDGASPANLSHRHNWLRDFWLNNDGASSAEYALVLAIIGTVIAAFALSTDVGSVARQAMVGRTPALNSTQSSQSVIQISASVGAKLRL
jgi:Flp pilus assembly pilin Flp